jgi:hypothetical protein
MKSVQRASGNAGKESKDRRPGKRQVSDTSDYSDSLSGHDSRKNSRQVEKDLLKAKEVEKALKRELQDLNAKNEAAKEKVNEIKHAVQTDRQLALLKSQ